jgi:hypothetical protein
MSGHKGGDLLSPTKVGDKKIPKGIPLGMPLLLETPNAPQPPHPVGVPPLVGGGEVDERGLQPSIKNKISAEFIAVGFSRRLSPTTHSLGRQIRLPRVLRQHRPPLQPRSGTIFHRSCA